MSTPTHVWEEVAPESSRSLSDEHRKVLEEGSQIDPEIIEARGYYSLTSEQMLLLVSRNVFPVVAMRADSWMGIPLIRPDGLKHGEIVRSFGEDIESRMKYIWPTGLRLCLDVHPLCTEDLSNPEIPVFLTEGVKKADAVLSAARREGIPLVVIAVNGCSGWKSRVEEAAHGTRGTTANQDFLDIVWEDRRVYVNSDSDYRTNNQVAAGWNGCATYLSSKTGEHRTYLVVTPPSGLDKQGADDFLVRGHSLHDLLGLAQSPERAVLDTSTERTPYRLKTGKQLIEESGEKIPHLLAPLIPEKSITLFAGHSGTYKTWNMLGLAIDGACGLSWQQHPRLDPEHGPFTTLYVNKEMSGIILGQRLRTLSQNARYTPVPDFQDIIEKRLLFLDDTDVDLAHEEHRERLEDAISEAEASLVILDSLSMCWHGEENSSTEVGVFYSQLRGIIQRTGCSFMLLHHLLKPAGGKTPKTNEASGFAVRGSGQLFQQADACVMTDLYRGSAGLQDEEERMIVMHHVKGRTSQELPAWVMRFTSLDGAFQSLSYLCLLSEAKAQAYADSGNMPQLQEWILAVSAGMPAMAATSGSPGFRSRQLVLMLQQSWDVEGKRPPSETTLVNGLKALVDAGKIVMIEENKKAGNLYKLAEEPPFDTDEESTTPAEAIGFKLPGQPADPDIEEE